MTSSTNRASLIERLEAEDPFRISNDGMTVAELPPPGKLRNPDGPEAAAIFRQFCALIDLTERVGFTPTIEQQLMDLVETIRAKASKS